LESENRGGDMKKTIALIATLDTKGEEIRYITELIKSKGKKSLIIDSSMRGTPVGIKADITRDAIAKAAGSSIQEVERKGRGDAEEIMCKGIAKLVCELYALGKFDGIMGVGGGDGAFLASAGMRTLPLGVPKLIVTPVAQGKENFGTYVGTTDMIMMHSVVDILGINKLSKMVFSTAVNAVIGMVEGHQRRKLRFENVVGTTTYGCSDPATKTAKKLLERKGYEIVGFHSNGTGGKAMEEFIERGFFIGILDIVTHEITDELYDGLHAGWPGRLTVAGKRGVPQVVAPGALDYILHGPLDKVPDRYRKRKYYYFNPGYTLIRTNEEEMAIIGSVIADRLNSSIGPTTICVPLKGFSMYSREGEALYDPQSDRAFIESLKKGLIPRINFVEVDTHINDPLFAQTAVDELLGII